MIHRHPLFFVHGLVLLALGAAMLLPAAVEALAGTGDAGAFLASAFITLSVGGFLTLAGRGHAIVLTRKEGFLLTATVWVGVSVFGALPFVFSVDALDYVDALFEAVSGLTTTGSTVIVGLDNLSPGILLWRGLLQWLGGIGIIGVAIVLLPFLQVGGMQLFRTESSDHSAKFMRGARETTVAILTVYMTLNVVCAVAFWFEGMPPLDAVVHAMSAVATGGFANYDASYGQYDSPVLWTTVIFMTAGALPMMWFVRIARGELSAFIDNSQVLNFFGVIAIASAAVAIYLIYHETMDPFDAVTHAAFNVTSVITTTGLASTDYTQWGVFPVGVFFILTFVGGCTGSTAGAIKIFRFEILRTVLVAHLHRLIDPRAVVPMKYDKRPLDADVLLSVMSFLLMYLVTVGMLGVALALTGLDPTTSLSAAATAVGNVGPGFGSIVGPAGNFATLSDTAKLLLSAGMMLGRLEFLTVLVLFSPTFWRA